MKVNAHINRRTALAATLSLLGALCATGLSATPYGAAVADETAPAASAAPATTPASAPAEGTDTPPTFGDCVHHAIDYDSKAGERSAPSLARAGSNSV